MFGYLLKKEFTLILRDIHALLVLFAMPTVFILVMSLALKNTYKNEVDIKLKIAIVSQEENKSIKQIIEHINKNTFFDTKYFQKGTVKEFLYQDNFDFVLEIKPTILDDIKNSKDFKINISAKADTQLQKIELLKSLIFDSLKTIALKEFLAIQNMSDDILLEPENNVKTNLVYKDSTKTINQNSTQQSVPAWLVFSMFFILIPISNTFINEKNFGTIDRIRTINVSLCQILVSKIFPYYLINQIQVLFMVLVGIYIVPFLGGDALIIKGNYFLIFLASTCVSFASISFALLIANISKTTEEATTYGGVSNIILAALGGIMVPKFIMPQFMQEVTEFSPMAWALQSFLEIFVRLGNFEDIVVNLLKLTIFGIACLLVSYFLLVKNKE